MLPFDRVKVGPLRDANQSPGAFELRLGGSYSGSFLPRRERVIFKGLLIPVVGFAKPFHCFPPLLVSM